MANSMDPAHVLADPPPAAASTWKKILLIVCVALLAFVTLLVVVVAMQPSEFRVARSATISAAPSAVFAQVNDLHSWEEWSPWAKIDPQMQQSYEGPPAGPGASFNWAGNSDVGEGRVTITESLPNERIRIRLEMFKPMAGTNDVEFTFAPEGDTTVVTWSMRGESGFVGKAFGLFMDMDKMVGDQFASGLAAMKSIVESAHD